MTQQEAEAIFKQMFGDKPVSEIVKDLEEAIKQQNEGFRAQENQVRDKVLKLRAEAQALQQAAQQERSPLRQANLMRQALQKSMQADQAQQAQQMMSWQHIQKRLQAQAAINNVKQMDPEVRAANRKENAVKTGVSWGVAMGAYFVWGWGLFGTLLLFMVTRFAVRVAFALSRLRQGKTY